MGGHTRGTENDRSTQIGKCLIGQSLHNHLIPNAVDIAMRDTDLNFAFFAHDASYIQGHTTQYAAKLAKKHEPTKYTRKYTLCHKQALQHLPIPPVFCNFAPC